MEELDEVKKRFKSKNKTISIDNNFEPYSKIYPHTNENLKEYIPDLTGKRILTVSASGDQLLNIIGRGATQIDTFDINKYSPIYQNLKLSAVRYLEYEDATKFLSKLDKKIYYKFNLSMASKDKEFFDYLFKYYEEKEIYERLFELDNRNFKNNNNYFDEVVFNYIKRTIRKIELKHYSVNIYQLPNYLSGKYDYIFLSNISEYALNVDRFLRFITYLKYFLNEDGKIYYAYIYKTYEKNVLNGICSINNSFKKFFNPQDYFDLVESTEIMNVKGAENRNKCDSVLILKK